MGARKTDSGGSFALGLLLFVVFMLLAWPYYLGTWLAVQFGAGNPSTARDVVGWFFEVLWLVFLVTIAAGAWLAKRREETQARRLEMEKRQRKLDFGADGARLYEQAEASVSKITESEAARTGWLGDRADFDFRADLEAISADLRRAEEIRKVTVDAASIRHFTEADTKMLQDAQRAVARLEGSVKQRVTLIGKCAQQADDIDSALRDGRERVDMARRREDLRRRLSPMIYGAQPISTETTSESADVVTARAAAFHELKALIDKHRADGRKPAALAATKNRL